jgi:hypothetical protein
MIRVKEEEGAVLESAQNGNKPSYSAIKEIHERM